MRISDWSSDVCSSDLQFLMLLLVMEAEVDKRQGGGRQTGQRIAHRGVDMRAPFIHVAERRARQQSAPRAGMALSLALIIAVEEKGIAVVEQAIARRMVAQHEAFEKPCRVREVPFGGRGVGRSEEHTYELQQPI